MEHFDYKSCKSCRLVAIVTTTIAFLFVATHPSRAEELQYTKRVQVASPTRLDWTFAAARRSLANPPSDLVGSDYDSTQQSYEFYGPSSPSELNQKLPLLLYLSPKDQADGWHRWEEVCRQNGFCFAGPRNAGAKQPLAIRMRIILDVLDDVKRRHKIDPDRTFVVGWAEGAHLACEVGYALPECFGGIIAIQGGESLPVPLWMRRRIAERLSVAFLSTQRGKAATFTELLFHPVAVGAGVKSIHWQRYAGKAKYPDKALLQETLLWVSDVAASRNCREISFHAIRY